MSRALQTFRFLFLFSIITSFYYIENVTLRRVSQEAAIAAPAFSWKWSAQLISEGFMALMFLAFVLPVVALLGAGVKRLAGAPETTSAPASTGPAALEAGTAAPSATVAASPKSKRTSACTVVKKTLGCLINGIGFGCWLWTHRVIAFQGKSPRENTGAALLTLLRGLGVFFGVVLILKALGWTMNTCAQAKKARAASQKQADLIQFEEEKKPLEVTESA